MGCVGSRGEAANAGSQSYLTCSKNPAVERGVVCATRNVLARVETYCSNCASIGAEVVGHERRKTANGTRKGEEE